MGASTPAFTLLTGETLSAAWRGEGSATMIVEYQAEELTNSPWVQLEEVPDLTDPCGLLRVPDLPRGNYRLTIIELISGSREAVFLAS